MSVNGDVVLSIELCELGLRLIVGVCIGVGLDEGVDINLRLFSDSCCLRLDDRAELKSGRNGVVDEARLGHIINALDRAAGQLDEV